jgi:hypothetical protein
MQPDVRVGDLKTDMEKNSGGPVALETIKRYSGNRSQAEKRL